MGSRVDECAGKEESTGSGLLERGLRLCNRLFLWWPNIYDFACEEAAPILHRTPKDSPDLPGRQAASDIPWKSPWLHLFLLILVLLLWF